MISISMPIKLVNTKKEQVIVSFPEGLKGKAVFNSKYSHVKEHMSEIGLSVPSQLKKGSLNFPTDKRRIYLKDPKFGSAFYELYYRETMDKTIFKWQEITK